MEARIAIRSAQGERLFVVEGATKTLLRPDLVVTSVAAPDRVLVGRPFAVEVTIAERNEDVGATATVALSAAGQSKPHRIILKLFRKACLGHGDPASNKKCSPVYRSKSKPPLTYL